MDVTCSNFDDAVKYLEQALPTAAFLSIDLEFTGLGEERPSHLDTPSDRYRWARNSALKFPPLQCGLCLFRNKADVDGREINLPKPNVNAYEPGEKDTVEAPAATCSNAEEAARDEDSANNTASSSKDNLNSNKKPHVSEGPVWEVMAFNFHLVPRAFYRKYGAKYPLRDRVMQLQASSIDFLVKHGFDFQKCFSEGVSWMRRKEEQSALAEMKASFRPALPNAKTRSVRMDDRERKISERFREDVGKWLVDKDTKPGSKTSLLANQYEVPRPVLHFTLAKFYPSVVMTLVRGERAMGMPSRWLLELFESSDAAFRVGESNRRKEFENMCERRVGEAVGFRRVIDAVIAARKPLVLHHGLLDVSKAIANFVTPLPPTLSDFKRLLTQSFPVVWDTRVLLTDEANSRPWLNSLLNSEQGRSISGIIKAFRDSSRQGEVPPLRLHVFHSDIDDCSQFARYDMPHSEEFAHEAGFDALQTGRLFLYLLGMKLGTPVTDDKVIDATSHERLVSCSNRIYLGSCGGFLDIDISAVAPVGVEKAVEEAVECDRNAWIPRSDVIVISGVKDEASEKLETYEIPYRVYDHVVEDLLAETSYCPKRSQVYPCENGTCIVLLKKPKKGQKRPAAKSAANSKPAKQSKNQQSKTSEDREAKNTGSNDMVKVNDSNSEQRETAKASATVEHISIDKSVNQKDVEMADSNTEREKVATGQLSSAPKKIPQNGDNDSCTTGKNVDEEDLARIHKAAKACNLTVKTYATSLRAGRKQRRMRFA